MRDFPPEAMDMDPEARRLIYGPDRLDQYDFRPYQIRMAKRILEKGRGVYLAAEMGLGKTAACLYAARKILDAYPKTKILIVAPVNVCKNTWPEEIDNWEFSKDITYAVATGTPAQREAALKSDVNVYILNRENLRWYWQYCKRKPPFSVLIYDEASRMKSGSRKSASKRDSEFGILCKMSAFFKKVVLLSGTPAPNGVQDLWGPIFIIDQGARLFPDRKQFIARWFYEDVYAHKIEILPGAQEEITDRISDVMISLKEKDYLTLPPLIEKTHYVEMDAAATKKYKRMKRDMILEEYDAVAVNNAVLTGKLLQLANGSVYDTNKKVHLVHQEKLTALRSIVEEAAGAPVLVAYSFKFDRDAIKKAFPQSRIFGETPNDIKDWNDRKIPILIANANSIGHGSNIQRGGNIMVWYGLTWSLELFQQFSKRLHRSGQKAEKVFMHYIITKDTDESKVYDTIRKKDATQNDITDCVRVICQQESL